MTATVDAGTEGTGAERPPDGEAFFTRWLTVSNAGDWAAMAELLHPQVELHDPLTNQPALGAAEVLARAQAQYAPFPDGHAEIVGRPFTGLDDRSLAYRWRFTGTHERPVDPPGFAPTGRRIELDGCSFLSFEDGRVRRIVMLYDTTSVARQLLAAPVAGSPLERGMVVAQRARAAWHRRRRTAPPHLGS